MVRNVFIKLIYYLLYKPFIKKKKKKKVSDDMSKLTFLTTEMLTLRGEAALLLLKSVCTGHQVITGIT